jgi:Tol biopolymer transport system component
MLAPKEVFMNTSWARFSQIYLNQRNLPRFFICALVVALLLSVLATETNRAELVVLKVSGEMPDYGRVEMDFDLSPDGRFLVFRADREHDGMVDLYSVLLPDGEPIRLNADLPDGGDVTAFLISPDSQYVVYHAGQDSNDVYELYSVPIQGGEPNKLNGPLVDEGNVDGIYLIDSYLYHYGFSISPDSQVVVYLADQEEDEQIELYSASITGDDWYPLNLTLPSDDDVIEFLITPNSQGVVYLTRENGSAVIHSTAITGGGSYTLTEDPAHAVEVIDYQITPNSLGVVYLADMETYGVNELFSTWIDGSGGPVKLNAELPDGGNVSSFQIAPNSQGVVYRADQNVDDQRELFSVRIDGLNRVTLNPSFSADRNGVGGFKITPNGLGVVYLMDLDEQWQYQLFSVLITGGDSYQINNPITGDDYVADFKITPNNLGVVYALNREGSGFFDIYSAWITGEGSAIKLNDFPIDSHAPGARYEISPNSQIVAYLSDVVGYAVLELYGNSTLGGLPIKLNAALVEGGSVSGFLITPDSAGVIYRADQEVDQKFELYMVYNQTSRRLYLPALIRQE